MVGGRLIESGIDKQPGFGYVAAIRFPEMLARGLPADEPSVEAWIRFFVEGSP
jgi:hypothetical protein